MPGRGKFWGPGVEDKLRAAHDGEVWWERGGWENLWRHPCLRMVYAAQGWTGQLFPQGKVRVALCRIQILIATVTLAAVFQRSFC